MAEAGHFLAGLAIAGGLLTSCSPPPASSTPPRRVLLVTLDTTRADRLGCYGYAGASTPALDRLAASGVRFEHAVAPSPTTLPSHATILTGALPARHGVRNNATYRLGPDLATLPERFREAGYRTGAVVASAILDSRFGLDRGFEEYDDAIPAPGEGLLRVPERPAAEVSRRALDWIRRQGEERWFLWVHYFDPHFEYSPAEPFAARFAGRPYDGEIASMDAALGVLLQDLRTRGLLEDTLVAVAADHGESLGEHGERSHGVFVYASTMRVPLLLAWERGLPRGRVVRGLVRLADLAPTILDHAGLPALEAAQGQSLRQEIERGEAAGLEALLESWLPRLNYGWSELVALQDGDWKYIRAPRPELYDLHSDPGETENRVARDPAVAQEYRERLEQALEQAAAGGASGPGAPIPLDSETERLLRSLGYLGAGDVPVGAAAPPGATAPAAAPLPDPKDRIAEFVELSEVLPLLAAGREEEAIARLETAARRDPGGVFIQRQLGNAYRRQGRFPEAEARLRAAVRLAPQHPDARVDLASLLVERAPAKDRMEEAEALLREALSQNPALASAHHFLGALHQKRGDAERAIEEYRAALGLDERRGLTIGNLATLLEARGDLAGALTLYQKGIEVDPSSARMHTSAAWILNRQGRRAEAAALLGRAADLEPASPRPLLALAEVLEAAGDAAGARAALGRAVDREASPGEARLRLARLLLALGDACGALRTLDPFGAGPSSRALREGVARVRSRAREGCGDRGGEP